MDIIYKHVLTIKGKKSYVSSKSLFIVDINNNIDHINKFFDQYNYLIKRIDIQVKHRRMKLFVWKRKRLGRFVAWSEREVKLLRK